MAWHCDRLDQASTDTKTPANMQSHKHTHTIIFHSTFAILFLLEAHYFLPLLAKSQQLDVTTSPDL